MGEWTRLTYRVLLPPLIVIREWAGWLRGTRG
jgi:hypothetical protein